MSDWIESGSSDIEKQLRDRKTREKKKRERCESIGSLNKI